MISPNTIEKIKEVARIEEVVGERLELRRRGSSLMACCPFHQEKTPSFHVNPARNFYHCFGCQAHGNSIQFVMEFEHKTFPEALRILAERYHIPVEERELSAEEKQMQDDRQSVRRVLAAAVEWAKKQFQTEAGQRYWQHLLTVWGIREDTCVTYELGCVPVHSELLDYLRFAGFEERFLQLSGLTEVDFSASVLLPFYTMSGDLLTLGAIALSDEEQAMQGLPPSGFWNKDNCLFGIREAVRRIPKDTPIFWMHSALDALRMAQSTDRRVVATPMSGLTEYMLQRVLIRFTHRLTLCCEERLQYNPQWINRCAWIMQQGMTLSILSGLEPVDFLQQQLDRVSLLPQEERSAQLEVFLRLLLFEQDTVVRDCYLHSAADALRLPYGKLQQVMKGLGETK